MTARVKPGRLKHRVRWHQLNTGATRDSAGGVSANDPAVYTERGVYWAGIEPILNSGSETYTEGRVQDLQRHRLVLRYSSETAAIRVRDRLEHRVVSTADAALGSYEQEVLADGPSEVWRCDTAASFESGIVASNPMVLVGSPAVQQPGPFTRESSSAIALDGSTQYLDFGTPSAIDAIWQNGGSLEYWVRVTGTQAGVLIGKQRVIGTVIGWDTRAVNHTSGRFQLQFMHRFVNGGPNQGIWVTEDRFVLGTWYHVVVVYNYDSPANTPTIYINKVARTLTVSQAPAGSRLSDESYFGRAADDANNGGRQGMWLSWSAWYKTTSLTAARVAAHYDAGIAPRGDVYDIKELINVNSEYRMIHCICTLHGATGESA